MTDEMKSESDLNGTPEGEASGDSNAFVVRTTSDVLPENVATTVRTQEAEINSAYQQLGRLEADYLQERGRLLRGLEAARNKQNLTLEGAARMMGLNIDAERWIFDIKTMNFTRGN